MEKDNAYLKMFTSENDFSSELVDPRQAVRNARGLPAMSCYGLHVYLLQLRHRMKHKARVVRVE